MEDTEAGVQYATSPRYSRGFVTKSHWKAGERHGARG